MKKLIILLTIGWMSMTTVSGQVLSWNPGVSAPIDNMNTRISRIFLTVDYYKNYIMYGVGFEMGCKENDKLTLSFRGGLNWAVKNFVLTPYGELGTDRHLKEQLSSIYFGYGLKATLKIVGPFGVFVDLHQRHPTYFVHEPQKTYSNISIALGIAIFDM